MRREISTAKSQLFQATGKRKTAVARAYMQPGKGAMVVNDIAFEKYFPNQTAKIIASKALIDSKLQDQMDIKINVAGGGTQGQIFAIRHAIAKALLEYNPE